MRVLEKKTTRTKKKYILVLLGISSLCIGVAGGFLFNPFLVGAGIAGLFLTCAGAEMMKKPQTSGLV